MMIEYIACSRKGSRREKNEDRVMVNNTVIYEGVITGKDQDELIAVLCDGVGGTSGGEVAAEIVASGFKNYNISTASAYSLMHHIHKLNNTVLNQQKLQIKYRNMASTVAGIVFCNNRYLLFNLGDTRIYDVKSGLLSLKTRDHISGKEDHNYFEPSPESCQDALTCYIGGSGYACNPSIIRGSISEDERYFLLCSDGIYKNITEENLKKALAENNTLEQKKRAILNLSLQNGSTDDMSLVLIKYVA